MRCIGLGFAFAICALAATDGLDRAERLRRAGNFNEAATAFQSAIAEQPESMIARYGLVRSLLGAGRVPEARRRAAEDLARWPASALAHLSSGEAAFRAADFVAANAEFNSVTQLDPNLARGWLGAGEMLSMISRFRSAADRFTKAYQLDPSDPDIVWAYVRSLPHGSRRAEVLERFRDSLGASAVGEGDSLAGSIALERALGSRPAFDLKSEYKSMTLKMDLIRPTYNTVAGWSLPVSFNGSKPHTIQLDTGAGGVIISGRFAEKLGLKRLAERKLSGIGDDGAQSGYSAIVDSIRIGDLTLENCPVRVSDRTFTADSDGLIGTDVFSDFRVTIDAPASVLDLEGLPVRPSAEPTEAQRVPSAPGLVHFFRFGHLMLIPTLVNKEPVSMFLVDTGSSSPLLSTELARRIGKPGKSLMFGSRGISGEVKQVYEARLVTLAFAGFTNRQNLVLSFDFSSLNNDTGTDISGILGVPLLEMFRFTIDYQNGTMQFQYKQ